MRASRAWSGALANFAFNSIDFVGILEDGKERIRPRALMGDNVIRSKLGDVISLNVLSTNFLFSPSELLPQSEHSGGHCGGICPAECFGLFAELLCALGLFGQQVLKMISGSSRIRIALLDIVAKKA